MEIAGLPGKGNPASYFATKAGGSSAPAKKMPPKRMASGIPGCQLSRNPLRPYSGLAGISCGAKFIADPWTMTDSGSPRARAANKSNKKGEGSP